MRRTSRMAFVFDRIILLSFCLRFVEGFSSVLAYELAVLLQHEKVIFLKSSFAFTKDSGGATMFFQCHLPNTL